MQQDFNSFLINILASAAYSFLLWLGSKPFKNDLRWRKFRLLVFGALWLILNIGFFLYFRTSAILLLVLTSWAQGYLIYKELDQFWSIGLAGADRQTRLGIEYEKSLEMCHSSFRFLGIGAGKLIGYRSAFEKAVDRCSRPGAPIRFLLCRPDNQELKKIALSAGKDELSFRNIVVQSLGELSRQKQARAKNIEVRLYDEFPTFRLMFINDEICLVSHYMLGKGGDGSDAPQIHVVKRSSSLDVESIFYGFDEYFQRMWERSTEWDWKTYLEEAK